LNQVPTKGDFDAEIQDPENWIPEAGQLIDGGKMGKGKVITPGPTQSYTKIGDLVPTWIPNRAMRPLPRRQPKVRSSGPRRARFDYGIGGFAFL
jgi:hypothetical protein